MKTLSTQALSLLLLLVTAVFPLFPLLSAATVMTEAHTPAPSPSPAGFIRSVCKLTKDDADVCYSSISPYANVINQNVNSLCCVGLTLAQSEARRVTTYVSGLKGRFSSTCNFVLGVAINQTSDSLGTIRQIAAGKGGDFNFAMDRVLDEMAAAMTNQDTCMNDFLEEPDGPVKKKALDLLTEAKTFTGIATAFVYYYSKEASP
ncbi:hypothetical protein QN277_018952 [Acacia crassicarpa]|uniref:Pectinesterase inhibitor domain-containing protein n=1 Tax=Acacia crassicarpa TaxID=499986 RepID=A0AAE1JWZ4_9FABA|nr:hypothetical protein QN277_018952 [Acacia crassicarpa]